MKIAILTLPLVDNYGGILQAYALREFLASQGHEVIHVEKKGTDSFIHYTDLNFNIWWYSKRLFKSCLNNKLKLQYQRVLKIRNNTKELRRFVEENIPRVIVASWGDLKKLGIDCIVVGSDQIWSPIYYKNIKDAFLHFAQGWEIKKISFAPSFGVGYCEFN